MLPLYIRDDGKSVSDVHTVESLRLLFESSPENATENFLESCNKLVGIVLSLQQLRSIGYFPESVLGWAYMCDPEKKLARSPPKRVLLRQQQKREQMDDPPSVASEIVSDTLTVSETHNRVENESYLVKEIQDQSEKLKHQSAAIARFTAKLRTIRNETEAIVAKRYEERIRDLEATIETSTTSVVVSKSTPLSVPLLPAVESIEMKNNDESLDNTGSIPSLLIKSSDADEKTPEIVPAVSSSLESVAVVPKGKTKKKREAKKRRAAGIAKAAHVAALYEATFGPSPVHSEPPTVDDKAPLCGCKDLLCVCESSVCAVDGAVDADLVVEALPLLEPGNVPSEPPLPSATLTNNDIASKFRELFARVTELEKRKDYGWVSGPL